MSEDSASVWLRDATIVTVDDDLRVVQGDVLVKDGEIRAVGAVDPKDAEGVRALELGGAVVMPGFVQTHIHLCQTLMRNLADDMALIDWLRRRIWPYEACLGPAELRASADLGLAELILGGTTTLLDMGTLRHTDQIGEAVEAAGIRAFIGKCMMDDTEQCPPYLLEDTQESLRQSLALADRWEGAARGRVRYAFAPRFAVSCTDRLLRDVAAVAADRGLFIHTHSSETEFENEYTRQRFGCSNIEYLERVGIAGERSVFAHGVHVSDHDCGLLAASGTAISHCPSSNLKLASGIANLPRYDELGVQVSLGADGAPCNNNLDGFVEMRLAALIQKPIHGPKAMPASRVVELATRDGARALGIDDQVGSVEPGKAADLMVVDLDANPGASPGGDVYSRLVYSAHRTDVRHVFCGGRQLVCDGELVGRDLGSMLASARRAQQDVLEGMRDISG